MKKLIKSKVFISAFLTSMLLFFFVMTPYINEMKRGSLSFTYEEYGFPFAHYSSHCFGTQVLWLGFAGNIIVAVIFSVIAGIGFKFIWSKISSRRLHLR